MKYVSNRQYQTIVWGEESPFYLSDGRVQERFIIIYQPVKQFSINVNYTCIIFEWICISKV